MKAVIHDDGVVRSTLVRDESEDSLYHVHSVQNTDPIFEHNKRLQIEQVQRDLSFGRRVARIPTLDYKKLKKTNPALFRGPAQARQKAWVQFLLSPYGAKYRVVEKSKI